jgi:hypothetical protein
MMRGAMACDATCVFAGTDHGTVVSELHYTAPHRNVIKLNLLNWDAEYFVRN